MLLSLCRCTDKAESLEVPDYLEEVLVDLGEPGHLLGVGGPALLEEDLGDGDDEAEPLLDVSLGEAGGLPGHLHGEAGWPLPSQQPGHQGGAGAGARAGAGAGAGAG